MFHTGLPFFLKPKTPPSDLDKATDGDPDTATGTGQTTTTGADVYGYVDLDLGVDGVYLVGAKMAAWSDDRPVLVHVYSKPDGVNWRPAQHQEVYHGEIFPGVICNAGGVVISGRHLRFRFHVEGATTAYAKIYEIWAYKLD